MRFDVKYKIIAYAVVSELIAYGSTFPHDNETIARLGQAIQNDDEAMARLGWAIQRAVQREQLKEICRDLDLDLPEGIGQ